MRIRSLRQLGAGAWKVRGEVSQPRRNSIPRPASPPEAMLTAAIIARYGDRAVPQYRPIASRRYSVDVALPAERIAIEIDGWQHHGRYLADFRRDREKDRALTLEGWRVLRFTAGEVRADVGACVDVVERVLCLPTARDGR